MISFRANGLELRARPFGARGRYGWRCWITDIVPSDHPTTILESVDQYSSYAGALIAACRFLWWLVWQRKRPSTSGVDDVRDRSDKHRSEEGRGSSAARSR